MTTNHPLKSRTNTVMSETSILVFSFITAFSAGIIIISALFLIIRKIETKFTKAGNITYALSAPEIEQRLNSK